MANTKIPAELSSTPGIIDNSNATAITIDSSENVGIGNTVASSMDGGANNLVVGTGSGTEGMTIYSGTANSGVIYFADGASGDDRFRGQIGYSHSDNAFNFRTNASASANMTIDSSGNLLVGQSSTTIPGIGNTTAGISIRGTDGSFFSRSLGSGDTNNVVSINRSTADGNILGFQKDGTAVGSISSVAGLYTAYGTQGNTGYLASAGNNEYAWDPDRIYPTTDNAQNLGLSSLRFKDLYLSGGAYLGGTGSANKLDDYEEGSWTPALTSGTFSSSSATYTKVGNMVTINLDAVVGTGGATKITNLPFTAADTVGCGIYASGQAVSSRTQFNWVIAGVSAFFRGTGDSVAFTTQSLSSGATIHASITYRTS